MTPFTPARVGLQVQLALARFAWSKGIAYALCTIGLIVWLVAVPRLRIKIDAERSASFAAQRALLTAQQSPPMPPRTVSEERLATFYDTLGDQRYAEQQVKTLFAVASKTGLVLKQADYTSAYDRNGRAHTYQIVLPVKGSYRAIRQFCEMTLLAIPFAALDHIGLKREAIANPTLEAKLRFTLYLADAATHPSRAAEERSAASGSGSTP